MLICSIYSSIDCKHWNITRNICYSGIQCHFSGLHYDFSYWINSFNKLSVLHANCVTLASISDLYSRKHNTERQTPCWPQPQTKLVNLDWKPTLSYTNQGNKDEELRCSTLEGVLRPSSQKRDYEWLFYLGLGRTLNMAHLNWYNYISHFPYQ